MNGQRCGVGLGFCPTLLSTLATLAKSAIHGSGRRRPGVGQCAACARGNGTLGRTRTPTLAGSKPASTPCARILNSLRYGHRTHQAKLAGFTARRSPIEHTADQGRFIWDLNPAKAACGPRPRAIGLDAVERWFRRDSNPHHLASEASTYANSATKP